ncbi:MAG: hypothetical protein EPO39_06880 [Candidatus Manganitrophaceae bacterium]|nr:MAG: hypothetical protein EPO39_06880 [Candidatus Manganitrophaceae bacterium]
MIMDEVEAGRAKFLEVLKQIDPKAEGVIPVRSTNNNFLISLSKGNARKFITVTEDDLIDMVDDDLIREGVETQIREALEAMRKSG